MFIYGEKYWRDTQESINNILLQGLSIIGS